MRHWQQCNALYAVVTGDALRSDMIGHGLTRAAEFTLERMEREALGVYHRVLEEGQR